MVEEGREAAGVRIPTATYRLQLHGGFTFTQAAALVDYLDALGVTDVYASPFLKSRAGSVHGYDVTDPTRLNPEIGNAADFAAFAGRLRDRDMGLIVDVVPNHMCIADRGNRWWNDVLENGPSSPYAGFFDIDWHPPKPHLADKVLLPVLGSQYGRALEQAEIQIAYADGAFTARYYDATFPVAPRSLLVILEPALAIVKQRYADAAPVVLELESILTAIRHLPLRSETDRAKVRERQREKEVVKRRLAALVDANPDVAAAIEAALTEVNGVPGDAASFDRLEALLADQAYRLSYWRVASDEINYRRFFDINELAAIRVERRRVFNAVHALVYRLIAQGWVTGLRIDHVDGLFDPAGYLRALQRGIAALPASSETSVAPRGIDAGAPDTRAAYLVVEKILERGERVPSGWPIHGTTGYEVLQQLDGVFVDTANAAAFRALYRDVTGRDERFEDVLITAKKLIMLISLASELHVLSLALDRISEQHRWSRDFTRESLRFGLREVIACFPVYRSYVRRRQDAPSPDDRRHVEVAIREAKRRNSTTDPSLFDFIGSVLLLEDPPGLSPAQRAERRRFVMRVQQLTGPVMAKGLEDTAFYRWFPLASLNEVGGDPRVFGTTVEQFHRANAERRDASPHGLSATATHDTKRGEDVRARLNVLSEIPGEWQSAVERWQAMNAASRREVDGALVPDPNEEYLLYQTLVGVWPFTLESEEAERTLRERVSAYMRKALKEAKLHTSWINPREEYERAVDAFVEAILAPGPFRADFERFQTRIARAAVHTALGRTLLKITVPGVPDLYQGTELWDSSLVDPDNRRPVDYAHRRDLLAGLDTSAETDPATLVRELAARPESGAIKLWVTSRALRCRRVERRLFADGAYVPLAAEGTRARHVVAFARRLDERSAITIVGRFLVAASEGAVVAARYWNDTRVRLDEGLARGAYRDVLTGRTMTIGGDTLALGDVLVDLPLALLVPA